MAILSGLVLAPVLAAAADVRVRVLNVANAAGSVRVAVCVGAQWLQPDCDHVSRVAARAGIVEVTVRGVPPGIYGVMAHHDANDNGVIDRTLLGIPTEGVGFSRDAPMRFGPPRFEDAAVRVGESLNTVNLTLRFEPQGATP